MSGGVFRATVNGSARKGFGELTDELYGSETIMPMWLEISECTTSASIFALCWAAQSCCTCICTAITVETGERAVVVRSLELSVVIKSRYAPISPFMPGGAEPCPENPGPGRSSLGLRADDFKPVSGCPVAVARET